MTDKRDENPIVNSIVTAPAAIHDSTAAIHDVSYQVIWDANQVLRFLDIFLPYLNDDPHYAFKIALFARRKYQQDLEDSEHILHRIFAYGGKPADLIVREIRRLHCPVGCFVSGDNTVVRNEALALYMCLKVKDAKKALGKVVGEMFDDSNPKKHFPLNSVKMMIGKTNATPNNKLVQIDFDTKDPTEVENAKKVFEQVGLLRRVVCAMETKNGYHIVYENDSAILHKTLHEYRMSTKMTTTTRTNEQRETPVFSFTHEPSVAVPGTYQGGWKVRFTNLFNPRQLIVNLRFAFKLEENIERYVERNVVEVKSNEEWTFVFKWGELATLKVGDHLYSRCRALVNPESDRIWFRQKGESETSGGEVIITGCVQIQSKYCIFAERYSKSRDGESSDGETFETLYWNIDL